jgi:hypothetical protein
MHLRILVVGALGLAQALAWGSSYYLPAIWPDRCGHFAAVLAALALAPLLFGDAIVVSVIVVSPALCLAAFTALFGLRASRSE